MQGRGRMGKLNLQTPAMIHFGEETEDEVFITPRSGHGRRGDRKHRQRAAGRPALLRPRRAREPAENRRLSEVIQRAPALGGSIVRTLRGLAAIPHTLPHEAVLCPHTIIFPNSTTRPGRAWSARAKAPSRPIELDTMLDLTAAAEVDGVKFDGFDLFLFDPHVSIDASDDDLKQLADKAQRAQPGDRLGRRAGLAARPAAARRWAAHDERKKFLEQVRKGCRIARRLREIGIRPYGVVRIDSADRRGRMGRRRPGGQQPEDRRHVPRGLQDRRGHWRAAGRRGRNLLGRHAQLAAHAATAGDGRPPADARLSGRHGPHAAVPAGLQRAGRRHPAGRFRLEGHATSSTRRSSS